MRNRLWRSFARVVDQSDCLVFVLENVDRFGDSPEFELLKRETRPGRSLRGFEIERYTLNAADYGVPQRRVRTIVIGSLVSGLPTCDPREGPGRTTAAVA